MPYRVTSKIPKKGGDGPLRRLCTQIVHDFKFTLRDPTDVGPKRNKPTPSEDVIEKNIQNFVRKRKDVRHDDIQLIPSVPHREKLLV